MTLEQWKKLTPAEKAEYCKKSVTWAPDSQYKTNVLKQAEKYEVKK